MENANQEKIVNVLGYEGLKIIQCDDTLKFSLDSTILAYFVSLNRNIKTIIDLGTGNGYIPLFLSLRTNAKIVGVELQPKLSEMAQKSVKINNLDYQIKILNENIKNLNNNFLPSSFDVVVSNPPYFKYDGNSNINKSEYLTIARHEKMITLEEIVSMSSYLLKDGGTFAMVHRSDRFLEIINTLAKYHLEPKRIKFIYAKTNSPDSIVIFIEAKKSLKKGGLKILNPLYVLDEFGNYTEEVKKIFNFRRDEKC